MSTKPQVLAARFAEELAATIPNVGAPIDPLLLLEGEPVEVVLDDFGLAFDGRLEYEPLTRSFILFCNSNAALGGPERMRFSLAHEVGHYYLDAHRESLRDPANAHYSKAGFVSDAAIEREADSFAARLLVPSALLGSQADRIDLALVKSVATRFNVSFLCAALRCVEATREACALIVAVGTEVTFSVRSDELYALGGFYVAKGERLPVESAAYAARLSSLAGGERFVEKSVAADAWTPHPRWSDAHVWEYAVHHPSLDRTVTLLLCESQGDE